LAVNPSVTLPAGFSCSVKQVLNSWEQTLYNLCEEYFYLNQRKSNRHPVLSQVRLADAISISHPSISGMQINSMSFDILVTDSNGYPRVVFEADGPSHFGPVQIARDQIKDAIAKMVGIPVFRVTVDGMQTHIEVVHAEAGIKEFQRDLEYPLVRNGYIEYSQANFPDKKRLLEAADLELCLIRAGWQFPTGWEFVTNYELR